MYRVIASYFGKQVIEALAILEKDGEFLFCGDWWCSHTQRILDRGLRPTEVEAMTSSHKGLMKHNPPLEVERIEDWPAAVRRLQETNNNST